VALRKEDIHWDKAEIWTPDTLPVAIPDHPEEFDEHVLRDHFTRAGCAGVSIGHVPNPQDFSNNILTDGYADIYRMPIKNAGSNEYRIPAELARYAGAIKLIANDQHARSPAARHKHAVLYVTRNHVSKNSFQRTPNWHCDDGESIAVRFQPENPVATNIPVHVYIASDCITTQVQSKPVANAYSLFGHAHGSVAEQNQCSRKLDPYEIALINNYVWHRGTLAEEASMRNFISVMYLPTVAIEKDIQSGAYAPKPRGLEF
jgi:hypothetical protein